MYHHIYANLIHIGHVKLGIHKATGEHVAIKMIPRRHLLSSTTIAQSVERELAILQLIHHPHLIQLKQVLQDTTYVYFITEYADGGELYHALAGRGRLPEDETKALFSQVVTALAWCHAHHIWYTHTFLFALHHPKGIKWWLCYLPCVVGNFPWFTSHRDLKPENILLDKTHTRIKIADFGMATMQPSPNDLLKTSCGCVSLFVLYSMTKQCIWCLQITTLCEPGNCSCKCSFVYMFGSVGKPALLGKALLRTGNRCMVMWGPALRPVDWSFSIWWWSCPKITSKDQIRS